MTYVLQDLFPGIALDALQLLSEISVNGGKACPTAVVSFFENGQMQVGRLLLSVGVKSTTSSVHSFISKLEQLNFDGPWLMCASSDDKVVQIESKFLDRVLLKRQSTDAATCSIFLPPELQPR